MSTHLETAQDLIVSRTINAPRDKVFAAWTEPEAIKAWFGPEGCDTTDAEIDARVGGRYLFTMNEGEHHGLRVSGTFEEVSPPDRLIFTWKWLTGPGEDLEETRVTVECLAAGDATEVRIKHEGLAGAMRDEHIKGWTGCLENLEKYL